MPGNFSAIDNSFPSFTGKESPTVQIQMLLNYLHIMKQELQYMLSNLTPENWNKEALEQMAQAVRSSLISTINGINEQVKSLSRQLDVLEQDAAYHTGELQRQGEQIRLIEEAVSTGEAHMQEQDTLLEEHSGQIADAEAAIGELEHTAHGLSNVCKALEQVHKRMGLSFGENGFSLGSEGARLDLVGQVYVNGVLLGGSE